MRNETSFPISFVRNSLSYGIDTYRFANERVLCNMGNVFTEPKLCESWENTYITKCPVKNIKEVFKISMWLEGECFEIDKTGEIYYIFYRRITDRNGYALFSIEEEEMPDDAFKTVAICYDRILYDNKNPMYFFIRKYLMYYCANNNIEIRYTSQCIRVLKKVQTPYDIGYKLAKLNGL